MCVCVCVCVYVSQLQLLAEMMVLKQQNARLLEDMHALKLQNGVNTALYSRGRSPPPQNSVNTAALVEALTASYESPRDRRAPVRALSPVPG